ncbi:MAG: hypothetical protein GY711_22870 [bacterium]|nr:hypothetical protein [bacterium]
MKIVSQHNDYACGLACLESFLFDCGRPTSQHTILSRHPHLCHLGEPIEGALDITIENLSEIGASCSFRVKKLLRDEDVLPPGQTYLLVATSLAGRDEKHCVRWQGEFHNGDYKVMDPLHSRRTNAREYALWPVDLIEESACMLFKLTVETVADPARKGAHGCRGRHHGSYEPDDRRRPSPLE